MWILLIFFSLIDVLHCDRKLYLVFEYVDYDLKKYMDKHAPTGIPINKVKVRLCVGMIPYNWFCSLGFKFHRRRKSLKL